jgi:hypothetical protein
MFKLEYIKMELTKPDEALSAGNKVNLNSKVL